HRLLLDRRRAFLDRGRRDHLDRRRVSVVRLEEQGHVGTAQGVLVAEVRLGVGRPERPGLPLPARRVALVVPDATTHAELVTTLVETAGHNAAVGTCRGAHAAARPYLPPRRVSRT